MPDDATVDASDDRVSTRADLLPEERSAGSDDPAAQAEAILTESEERIAARDAGVVGPEHRTSEDVTPPPG